MRPKENSELSANSLQSPDDLEAAYREKRGKGYQGYVANLTETCDPENPLQLITKVQVAPNNVDDSQLLAEALPDLKKRTNLETVYADGGYGGPQSDPVLQAQDVALIQTAIRGQKRNPELLYLDDFAPAQEEEQDVPRQMTCPAGQTLRVALSAVSSSQAHFAQMMEFYNEKSFIHYGLGNLFFDQMGDIPYSPGIRREFIDRYVIYDGQLINVEPLTMMLTDYAHPRPMTPAERAAFLNEYFYHSGWGELLPTPTPPPTVTLTLMSLPKPFITLPPTSIP